MAQTVTLFLCTSIPAHRSSTRSNARHPQTHKNSPADDCSSKESPSRARKKAATIRGASQSSGPDSSSGFTGTSVKPASTTGGTAEFNQCQFSSFVAVPQAPWVTPQKCC